MTDGLYIGPIQHDPQLASMDACWCRDCDDPTSTVWPNRITAGDEDIAFYPDGDMEETK